MKLGHPSDKILQLIVSDHPDIFSPSIIACDACAFAKQKRLKYSSINLFNFLNLSMLIFGPNFRLFRFSSLSQKSVLWG